MVADVFSLLLALGGFVTATLTMVRWQSLPRSSRLGLNSSTFGLFVTSRYVSVDHGFHAMFFALGATAIMLVTITNLLWQEGSPL